MDDVNDKLKPAGLPLRKIYTSAGGTQVRSLSALVNHKDYLASPSKLKKSSLSNKNSRKNSKKSSAASSGYSSDDKKGKGRLSLIDRQNLYAKNRSQSEPPTPRDKSSTRTSPASRNKNKKGAVKSRQGQYIDDNKLDKRLK